MVNEIRALDATAQAELVRKREVTAAELLDITIARIEERNPELNAVIAPLFDGARRTRPSDGPFSGVPFLLKDLGATSAGDPLCAGSRVLRDAGHRSAADSFYMERIRAAGFVLCGKTNTPELGIVPTTEPIAFGPTRNPYDPSRSTGGSSGGSAAAVASGMVPVAHANDGGGSIRIPASCCGLVGLKPSRGRVSAGPTRGELGLGLAVEHVVTRSVRDSAALLDLLAGPMPGDPYHAPPPARPYREEVGAPPGKLRIAFHDHYVDATGTRRRAHADCVAAVAETARLLEELGHHVEEAALPALDSAEFTTKFTVIWATSVRVAVEELAMVIGRAVTAAEVEPLTWALRNAADAIPAQSYAGAWIWLHRHSRKVAELWRTHDLLLTPTLAEPPLRIGELAQNPNLPLAPLVRASTYATFTPLFNVTGQPAISLPLCRNGAGLPIGVQLVADYGREDLLLRAAGELERARPFSHPHM